MPTTNGRYEPTEAAKSALDALEYYALEKGRAELLKAVRQANHGQDVSDALLKEARSVVVCVNTELIHGNKRSLSDLMALRDVLTHFGIAISDAAKTEG